MDDLKMEMFFSKEMWENMIQKAVEKHLNKGLLRMYSRPEYRCRLMEAIENGMYDVAPPHIAKIPKDDGGVREVYVNEDMDRLVLSIIGEIYSTIYSDRIHHCCVSYQKGIGVSRIVKQLSKKVCRLKNKDVCGYKIDISKYFDSYNKENLYRDIDSVDTGSPIDLIVQKYYRDDMIIDDDGNIVEHYKSIAQGCAVSPFFANYALRDVDEAISKLNVIYYRYSDDAVFIGEDADIALETFSNMLNEKGLKLNPKKIETISYGKWFTFLGFRINGDKISLSKKSIKNFQREIKLRTPINKDTKWNEESLGKAIKDIYYYLYTAYIKSEHNFGWAEYFFSTLNIEDDIIELDEFIKDRLRGMYTGNSKIGGLGTSELTYRGICHRTGESVGINKKIMSNDELRKYGYISMNYLYKMFNHSKDVYRMEVNRKMM